jgi:hypothetical protein
VNACEVPASWHEREFEGWFDGEHFIRHANRMPEILAAARTFSPFLPLTLDYLDAKP